LFDLGVWWKYRLVGHVWVHESKLYSIFLRCLSENDTSLLCAWFWNGALGSLQHLWHWCCHIEVKRGYTPHQVTHGVCDPKELRATTSCGNVLCLGSGLSNTRLFAGRPRHQTRSQELASLEVDFLSNRHPAKSVSENHDDLKKKMRSTKGRSQEYDVSTWICGWPLADAKSLETLENERIDIPRTGCPASSPSSWEVTRACFSTPFGPRVHLPHLHQEL
jgi:hypothetical protein